MTLREIIYDVQEKLNAYADDTKFSDEHIAFLVNNKRNMLLRQYMSNLKKEVPLEAKQTICVPLEIDANCFEDMEVLASINSLPSTLDNTGRSNILAAYVGSRFAKHINIIDYARIPYVRAEKYNKLLTFVAVDPHSRLIVYNQSGNHLLLESMEVEAVFENPEEAYEFTCETEGEIKCDFYDAQYPIESSLIDPLTNQIVRELLIKHQIPLDHTNDGEDNTVLPLTRQRRRDITNET